MADHRKGELTNTAPHAPGGSADTPTEADTRVPTSAAAEDRLLAGAANRLAVGARYRLGDVIGRGGMGEVVSAHDTQLGRSVAIKRLRTSAAPEEAVSRFLREARIQGRLDHPAVVPVHELSQDDAGQPFFVMKQLTGITLADVLAADDPAPTDRYPRQRLLRAFVEVCLAIEFAHTRGVVHRDLKPANIMLGDFGEVYVLDWGIARVIGDDPRAAGFDDVDTLEGGASATLAGAMLGTPGYMAPEQIHGDAGLDGRADVYALGCILFELLAGQPLHRRGQTALASTLAGLDARPSVRAPEREIAPELDAVCVAATALEPGERPTTAREVGDAVQRFLDGDRDLATRAKLARDELAAAQAARARGNSPADRRDAIRAAARALALDPSSTDAGVLVGRLMMEPPAEAPPEVELEVEASDMAAIRSHAGIALRALPSYLLFFPVLYLAGLRGTWYLVGGPILVGLLVLAAHRLTRHVSLATILLGFGANGLLIACFSRVLSPLLVAPGLATLGVMVFAMHPWAGRAWLLCAGYLAMALLPWLAELVGLLSPTISVSGDTLVLRTAGARLEPTVTQAGLALFIVILVGLATMLSRSLANNRRDMQRTLQLQSWQLRQLVPAQLTAGT